MIPISMMQKQSLESMPAAAQIIDRIGSRPAQVANGLIGRFRNVDGFQLPGSEQSRQFHRIAAVGLYPVPSAFRSHRGGHHKARHSELAHPTRDDESTGACFVADL